GPRPGAVRQDRREQAGEAAAAARPGRHAAEPGVGPHSRGAGEALGGPEATRDEAAERGSALGAGGRRTVAAPAAGRGRSEDGSLVDGRLCPQERAGRFGRPPATLVRLGPEYRRRGGVEWNSLPSDLSPGTMCGRFSLSTKPEA